jgi:hypothetical protein
MAFRPTEPSSALEEAVILTPGFSARFTEANRGAGLYEDLNSVGTNPRALNEVLKFER